MSDYFLIYTTVSFIILRTELLHLFNCSANHIAAAQCIKACKHGQDNVLKWKLSLTMWKKNDLHDFECHMVVATKQGDVSIFTNF